MTDLLNKILTNSSNHKVLDFLGIDKNQSNHYFTKWVAGRNSPDEGGTSLFENYGKEIPEECKYSFSTNTIMVNPNTGVIFAFNTGRYSMFFRCDFERSGIANSDKYRKGFTFDCINDITMLGENWAYLEKFVEDEEEQLSWAYEKVLKKRE